MNRYLLTVTGGRAGRAVNLLEFEAADDDTAITAGRRLAREHGGNLDQRTEGDRWRNFTLCSQRDGRWHELVSWVPSS
ncbi:hypothetical protein [Modestobacter sp. SSW1-42]|uniref:hypothetical protein n=1 Tax=Modestobacter sp. SSW1-42 TaxID=596372 RepID=UPI00398875E5